MRQSPNSTGARAWLPPHAVLAAVGLLAFGVFRTAPALAQRLEIDVPGAADAQVVPLVWGRVDGDAVQIGADVTRRARLTQQPGVAAAGAAVKAPRAGKGVTARYDFKPAELKSCGAGSRFEAFLALLASLGPKIESVEWRGTPDWDACADKVAANLKRAGLEMVRVEDAPEIALVVTFYAASPDVAQKSGTTAPSSPTPGDQPLATPLRVRLAGKPVALTSDGWFVARTTGYAPVALDVDGGGFAPLSKTVTPSPVPLGASAAPSGSGVKELLVAAGKPAARVAYRDLPPAAHAVVVDGIAGGGISVGRRLPKEAASHRLSAAATVSWRDVGFGYGLRAGVSGTWADSSVVPWTLLADATVTKSGAWGESAVAWRIGAGSRLFRSAIKAAKEREASIVPEQVVAPLLEAGVETVLGTVLLVGADVRYVPLYVVGAGYHPSVNPTVELGWLLGNGRALILGAKSDTVKYPTLTHEASLRLDTVYLSFRQGF